MLTTISKTLVKVTKIGSYILEVTNFNFFTSWFDHGLPLSNIIFLFLFH